MLSGSIYVAKPPLRSPVLSFPYLFRSFKQLLVEVKCKENIYRVFLQILKN